MAIIRDGGWPSTKIVQKSLPEEKSMFFMMRSWHFGGGSAGPGLALKDIQLPFVHTEYMVQILN